MPVVPRSKIAGLLRAGPFVLLAVASIFGVLEVHLSTDTWIALAAGRQIVESGHVPLVDSMSYLAAGRVWYNQNWLSHAALYWIDSRISPAAVVIVTWMAGLGIFWLVYGAACRRSGSRTLGALAGAAAAIGCRDFLSARPATFGLLCVAAVWAILSALDLPDPKKDPTPPEPRSLRREILLWSALLAVMILWGNLHGSFVFGYVVLGLYFLRDCGALATARTTRTETASGPPLGDGRKGASRDAAPGLRSGGENARVLGPGGRSRSDNALESLSTDPLCRRILGAAVVILLAVIANVVLNPFHVANFTHPGKVAGSPVFRSVAEWQPPWKGSGVHSALPRFWGILAGSVIALAAAARLGRTARKGASLSETVRSGSVQAGAFPFLFDLAAVLVSLGLALWARRFSPIFYILSIPVLAGWIRVLLERAPRETRDRAARWTLAASWMAAVLLALVTVSAAVRDLVQPDRQAMAAETAAPDDLLERVTADRMAPHEAIEYLNRNEVAVNLLTEWNWAGPVLFRAPGVKVFMDGRSQQVYSEAEYLRFCRLLLLPETSPEERLAILDGIDPRIPESGRSREGARLPRTDAVLILPGGASQFLLRVLINRPEWGMILFDPNAALLLRRGCPAAVELGARLRAGREWRPDTPAAAAGRGNLWMLLDPPDPARALECWKTALAGEPWTGMLLYPRIAEALADHGRPGEAEEFFRAEEARLSGPVPGLDAGQRDQLLKALENSRSRILGPFGAGRPVP